MKSDSVKGNITFEDWKSRTRNVMMHEFGIDISSDPNIDYQGLYEEGWTPREASDIVCKDNPDCLKQEEEDEEED